MQKIQAQLRRKGQKAQIVTDDGCPLHGVDVVRFSPMDNQEMVELIIRIKAYKPQEWKEV